MKVLTLIPIVALMAACQTTTGPSTTSSSSVGSLMTSFLQSNYNQNGGWSDADRARHKCPEEPWFYEGIANATSVAELDAFAQANGFQTSRTVATARMVLNGEAVPESLLDKARCITPASIAQVR